MTVTREATPTRIDHVSVVMIAKNEEHGIAAALGRLRDFAEVIVVDSVSEDRTREIAESMGARVVDFVWDGRYPKKKQWALDHGGASNDWVLLLDADEYPSPELLDAIRSLGADPGAGGVAAYDLALSYRFAGRFLQHGHRVTKRSLLDRSRTHFPEVDDLDAPGIREVEGHYQPECDGRVERLAGALMHDDTDPVASWFDRHNRYSDWEAHLRMNAAVRAKVAAKRSRQGRLFDRVPFKPVVFFGYAYLLRGGFRDGRAGLDYAVALATYYWQIGVKLRELERAAVEGAP